MEYVQPFGVGDADAAYINGNPVAGIEGSIPPAAAIEHPQREIVNLIRKAGIETDFNDLMQLLKGVRSGSLNYAEDTGTANNLVVSYDPPFLGIPVGLPLRIKALHANTSTNVNVSVDSNGAVPLLRANGSVPDVGDYSAGQILVVAFDGTNFQMVNFRGITAETTNNSTFIVDIPYVADTSINPNTVVASFTPAITSLTAGDLFQVKIANTNTATSQIIVNALVAKAIRNMDGTGLVPGQMVAGQIALLDYDGTAFQLLNPAIAKSASGGVSMVKRNFYIDTASHTTSSLHAPVEAIRFAYQPVAGGNKLRLDFSTTIMGGVEGRFVSKLMSALWMQASSDNGSTWLQGPATGFNIGIANDLGSANTAASQVEHFNTVRFLGDYTVPVGAPPLLFRVLFQCVADSTLATTIQANATTFEILELTG